MRGRKSFMCEGTCKRENVFYNRSSNVDRLNVFWINFSVHHICIGETYLTSFPVCH